MVDNLKDPKLMRDGRRPYDWHDPVLDDNPGAAPIPVQTHPTRRFWFGIAVAAVASIPMWVALIIWAL